MMTKPIVYSCSGCSSAAQLANDLAVNLDRSGCATMSCIAGIGGGVASLVRQAKKAKKIIAIDGCSHQCCFECLKKIDLKPDVHVVLQNKGVEKKYHSNYKKEDFEENLSQIKSFICTHLKK